MRGPLLSGLALLLLLASCSAGGVRPLPGLNQQLAKLNGSKSPSLAGAWLAFLAPRQAGRLQVQLIDLSRAAPVPLAGLNRPDAQPISVAVDQRGEQLAVVRQREDRTELLLYRRSLQSSQVVPMEPAGVPRSLSFSANGRWLAVEVSRGGIWQIDLLELP